MKSTPHAGRGHPAADESGFSLLEVVMAVAIIGIGFVALLGAMATSVKASGLARTQAVAELEVRRYAELISAATWSSTATYPVPSGVPSADAVASPFNLVVDTSVPAPICRDAVGSVLSCSSSGVQTQTITVGIRATDNKVQESVQVVKRALS